MNTWTSHQLLADGNNTDPDLITARQRQANLQLMTAEFNDELNQHRRQHGSFYRFNGVEDFRAAMGDGGAEVTLDDLKAAVEHDNTWHLYAGQIQDVLGPMLDQVRHDVRQLERQEGPALAHLRAKLTELVAAVRNAGEEPPTRTRALFVDNYAALRQAQAALYARTSETGQAVPILPGHEARNIVDVFPLVATWSDPGYLVDQVTQERTRIPAPWPEDPWGRLLWFCQPEVDLWVPSLAQTSKVHQSGSPVDMSPTENTLRRPTRGDLLDPRTGRTVARDEVHA